MKKILFVGFLTLSLLILPQTSLAQGLNNLSISQLQAIVASLQAQLNALVLQLQQRQATSTNVTAACTPAGEIVGSGTPPCCRGLQKIPTSYSGRIYKCLTTTSATPPIVKPIEVIKPIQITIPSVQSSLKVTVLKGGIYCIKAPCEFPLAGAKVSLYDKNKVLVATKTVGTDGAVTFTDLNPGAYTAYASATGYVNNSYAINVLTGQMATAKITLNLNNTTF